MNIANGLVAAYNDGYKQGVEDATEKCKRELKTCRNELCLHCGQYKERHKGACDGCRWSDSDG